MTLSLEERFARQLHVRSDQYTQEAGTDNTLPPNIAVIPRSRRMELAPHNVRIRDYLKEHDDLFRQLDELKEKVVQHLQPTVVQPTDFMYPGMEYC